MQADLHLLVLASSGTSPLKKKKNHEIFRSEQIDALCATGARDHRPSFAWLRRGQGGVVVLAEELKLILLATIPA